MAYIWQHKDWTRFTWNSEEIEGLLGEVRHRQGLLVGALTAFGFDVNSQAQLEAATRELVASSAIEGVQLNADSVRSSVAYRLGLPNRNNSHDSDHYVDGIVEVMADASTNFNKPLTPERLFGWHAALFPTGYSGPYKIIVGDWRKGDEPMQVVSGAMGKERIHYQAPPSENVPSMMDEFIQWVEADSKTDAVLRAAIAHLWFVTIHPFDDGNGRICRTVTDMMLARADGMPQRFYSMSDEINRRKKEYYEILEQTQRGTSDITPWIKWFLNCLSESIQKSRNIVDKTMYKVAFWNRFGNSNLNTRQVKILNMLWDDFYGNLTATKYAKIAKCSPDTALNDINKLIAAGALKKNPSGGRSTSYSLCDFEGV